MTKSAVHPRGMVLVCAVAMALLSLSACAPLTFDEGFRERAFDQYFDAVEENFPFFDLVTTDWPQLIADARGRAVHATSYSEFLHIVAGALAELRDPHVRLFIPPWREPGDETPRCLASIEVVVVDGRLHVVDWTAADGAPPPTPPGPNSAPELVAIDGYPAQLGLMDALLTGPKGVPAELTLAWPDGTTSIQPVLRLPWTELPKKASPVVPLGFSRWLRWISGVRVGDLGIIRIDSFEDEFIRSSSWRLTRDIEDIVERLGDVNALLVDLQYNRGGSLNAGVTLGSYLVDEPVPVGQFERTILGLIPYTSDLAFEPRSKSFACAVAVLVNGRTASMAEHVAASLQRAGRATVIGEQTAGAEAAIFTVTAEDKSLLQFGAKPLIEDREQNFQGRGITPDISVPLTIEEVRDFGVDQARERVHLARIRAALEVLGSSVEADAVPTPNDVDLVLGLIRE